VYKRQGTRCVNSMPSLGFDFGTNNSTPFVDLLYASEINVALVDWAEPSSWPNSQALMQAVATRNGRIPLPVPDLFLIYGSWSPEHLSVNGIMCYFDIRTGQANVTYQLNTTQVVEVQSDAAFSYLPNTGDCTPWNGPRNDQLESFLPNNGSLWSAALNGSDAAAFDSLDGAVTIAERISRIYNTYYTQYYNVALRQHNVTSGTNETAGLAWDDDWQRLVQDAATTRVLQALLAAMWLCTTIALVLFDTKRLITKNPSCIAAQASLLADSKFLDMIPAGAENATAEELRQMTPFVDHEFSMGWWDDGNGGRRFGIDVEAADFDRDVDGTDQEEEEVSA